MVPHDSTLIRGLSFSSSIIDYYLDSLTCCKVNYQTLAKMSTSPCVKSNPGLATARPPITLIFCVRTWSHV